jgi:hypothetical protein
MRFCPRHRQRRGHRNRQGHRHRCRHKQGHGSRDLSLSLDIIHVVGMSARDGSLKSKLARRGGGVGEERDGEEAMGTRVAVTNLGMRSRRRRG